MTFWGYSKDQHWLSVASEESPLFLSFQKTLKNKILNYVQDDKKDKLQKFRNSLSRAVFTQFYDLQRFYSIL
jgi:hypothetical protein